MQLTSLLHDVLDRAIAVSRASLGNIQLLNSRLNALEIVAQRGFDDDFLDLFRYVRADEPSACARVLRWGQRVVIPDVREDRMFAPYRTIAAHAGYCAVQSTPIVLHDRICGVLSTHFPQPVTLDDRCEFLLDECAAAAALLVERFRAIAPDAGAMA